MHQLENIVLNFSNIIFYWSYLVFPFLLFCIFQYKNWKTLKNTKKIILIILTILSFLFIQARFIEPNIITIQNTKISLWLEKSIKIALIADLHLWVYADEYILEKTVNKINEITDIDYVLIAWDLTLFDEKKDEKYIEELFSAIRNIEPPVYWVLWNHDVQKPWPDVRKELISVLEDIWVQFLNNTSVKLWEVTLLWLWSNWWWEDDVSLLDSLNDDDKVIVLTHNPDTTSKYINSHADITLSWHTHGWQIKIPYLYKKVIPTKWEFDEWLTQERYTQLFITSWIWTTWLPFRFLNPPVIDVLEIN